MDGGNYIKQGRDVNRNTWVVFSPNSQDGSGVLAEILEIFRVRTKKWESSHIWMHYCTISTLKRNYSDALHVSDELLTLRT